MIGNRFSQFKEPEKNIFDTLFELLQELLVYTSGDVDEALDWLNQLDKQYQITTPEYGMGDFIQELKDRGFLKEDEPDFYRLFFDIKNGLQNYIKEQSREKFKNKNRG